MPAKYATSYMPTNGATVTRNVDNLQWAFSARPQAMTVYLRFVELTKGPAWSADLVLFQIGATDNSDPKFRIYRVGSAATYRAQHDNGATAVQSSVTLSQSFGDVVELVAQIAATGIVTLIGTKNGGAATTAAASSAAVLFPAWSGAVMMVGNRAGLATGAAAFTHVAVMRGVQTLAAMRRVAGVA